jgi:hypothetical protein
MEHKEDYNRIQESKVARGGNDFRFPIAGELANHWEKIDIPLGNLMERDDLQLYVGNPGEIWTDIYRQTGTSQANEVGKNWETIREYLPQNHRERIENIGSDLAKLVVYNQESGEDYPLYIVENSFVLPYTTGSIIDGNNRLLALLNELRNGNLQESTPIPVWTAKIPTALVLPYNALTFTIDKKPLYERILLVRERFNLKK